MKKTSQSQQLDPNQLRQLPIEQLVNLIVQQQQEIQPLQISNFWTRFVQLGDTDCPV